MSRHPRSRPGRARARSAARRAEAGARPSTRREPDPPPRSRRRSAGTTGSSSTPAPGPRGRAALPARPDHLLQLRVRLRPARLRRQGDLADPQVRGQPRAPGLAGPQLRQGPGDDQPGLRPRPHPVPAEARGRARRGPVGAHHLGRGAGRASPRASGAAFREGRHNEVIYHVGRPGDDGYIERVLAAWGIDGHNSHTNICSCGAPDRVRSSGWASTGPPGPRQRQRDPADLRAPRGRPLLQPARAAHHRGQAARGQAHRARPAPVEHRDACRPLAVAVARQRGRDPPGHRQPPAPAPAGTTAASSAGGGTGRSTWRELRPELAVHVRDVPAVLARPLRRLHASSTRPPSRGSSADSARRDRRGRRRVPGRGSPPHLAGGRGRQPGRLAGGALLFLLTVLTGAVGTEGGTCPNGWNKFIPRPTTCRRTRAAGTS